MRVFSRVFSFFAALFLYDEWNKFQKILFYSYSLYKKDNYIPPLLAQQLLISGEDHRFFLHGGIDLIAVCRVIWRRVVSGKREGASTIEMQIVRIISGRFELTLQRKIREMALATLLTQVIPKNQLPAFYLYVGYYGWRMNSFKDACGRLKLGKNFLSVIEAAQLVARLKYPQSKRVVEKRLNQINIRAEYLLYLYSKHQVNKTYSGLHKLVLKYETI